MDFDALMREALFYGEKGRFHTCPNPAVGAVLARDGAIIAHGWHHGPGQPHAEIECLSQAIKKGLSAEGATMAVTLEPCIHYGKTPPCADTLLKAGISRLVYGTKDPNPLAAGGAEKLKEAGVDVIGPVLEQECRDLIADFIIWQTTERPYIILKLAETLDGRIATRTGQSRWISSRESRKMVHKLRREIGACGGAILIGGNTFRTDNPQLTARCPDAAVQPLACILASSLPEASSPFHLLRERPAQTIFFTSQAAASSPQATALRELGCRIFPFLSGAEPDFHKIFKIMREELHCPYVLCEGGGTLALSLLEADLVDEFHLHIAPLILGDNEARPLFNGRTASELKNAIGMRFCGTDIIGGDLHLLLRGSGA